MNKEDVSAYLEFKSFVVGSEQTFKSITLVEAMDHSQVHTFGWPIGIVMQKDEYKPKPTTEGVRATIGTGDSYDYWTISKKAELYSFNSLFEDRRKKNVIFFDSRVCRTTEVFMRVGKLYDFLKIDAESDVAIEIRYEGLKGRTLSVANSMRHMAFERKCDVSTYTHKGVYKLSALLKSNSIKESVFN